MSRWIALVTDEVLQSPHATIVAAARTKALASGNPDPLPGLIANVVLAIRRKIESNRRNVPDADATKIPGSLRGLAIDLAAFDLITGYRQDLTDAQAEIRREHWKNLNRIADGTDVVELADNPIGAAESQPAGGTPSISTTGARQRRERRSGL